MSQLLIVGARSPGLQAWLQGSTAAEAIGSAIGRRQPVGARHWSSGCLHSFIVGHDPVVGGADLTIEQMARDVELLASAHLSIEGRSEALVLQTTRVPWRTLWMAEDDDLVVLATSLQHVAFLLRSVELDSVAPTQFLLTGTLGPERSWDRRVRQVPPGARVTIRGDGAASEVVPSTMDLGAPSGRSDAEGRGALRERITAAVGSVLDDERWVLPLSGGYDSRGILLLAPTKPQTITWGTAASRNDRRSDSAIAARLAAACGVDNRFIEIPATSAEPDRVLAAFTSAAEGRVDHIDAYADGLEAWADLAQRGIRGVIRGDEAFGWVNRQTERGVRRSVGALGADDVGGRPTLDLIGDRSSTWSLPRRPDESLATYRDRLYRAFRVPSVLAPLNQVKAFFVDITCPLLDPAVVEVAASLDDAQRTDKRLFTELVQGLSPRVPYAQRSALPTTSFSSQPHVRRHLADRLEGSRSQLFEPELVQALTASGRRDPTSASSRSGLARARRAARAVVPASVVKRMARAQVEGPISLGDDALRLRVVLADEAVSLLRSSAASGASTIGERPTDQQVVWPGTR